MDRDGQVSADGINGRTGYLYRSYQAFTATLKGFTVPILQMRETDIK